MASAFSETISRLTSDTAKWFGRVAILLVTGIAVWWSVDP